MHYWSKWRLNSASCRRFNRSFPHCPTLHWTIEQFRNVLVDMRIGRAGAVDKAKDLLATIVQPSIVSFTAMKSLFLLIFQSERNSSWPVNRCLWIQSNRNWHSSIVFSCSCKRCPINRYLFSTRVGRWDSLDLFISLRRCPPITRSTWGRSSTSFADVLWVNWDTFVDSLGTTSWCTWTRQFYSRSDDRRSHSSLGSLKTLGDRCMRFLD